MSASAPWDAVARRLVGDPELTGPEVARQSGVDIEQARRLWRALGLAPVPDDEPVFTRADVAVLRATRGLLEEQETHADVLLQLTRVIGQSLARIAEAQVSSTADRPELGPSVGAADGVQAIADRITALVPQIEPFLGYVWRRHLLAALFRFTAGKGDHGTAGRVLAVGFADLVGFTAISQQLTARELAAMVDHFEALAYEHIVERGGRVVKMIGDEVMFAAENPLAAAEIALALVDAYSDDATLPDVRAGLAIGPTLSWEGDLFGPTVNLASRLVNVARPGTVLISDALGNDLQGRPAFAFRHLRPLSLRGIGRVRVWVLRRSRQSRHLPPRPEAPRTSS